MSQQSLEQQIIKLLQKTINDTFEGQITKDMQKHIDNLKLEAPKVKSYGDKGSFGHYASPIFLNPDFVALNKNPQQIAEEIASVLNNKKNDLISNTKMAGPGFLNITLTHKTIENEIKKILEVKDEYGNSDFLKNKKIMVEFAQPNTHKAFHIGHLRNICLGESITRIINSQNAKTFRANYQGDVGLHVAKCLWAIQKEELPTNLTTPQAKAEYLGKIYAKGGKAYEEDIKAKQEIHVINKKIYAHDPEIMPLWEKTRQWSLEYFDYIYQRLGSHFDRLFFESETFESGKKLVLEFLKKGVFEESQGAIIFDGEKHGLHKRVFITAEGNPTYEGKEIALAKLESDTFPFEKNIHVVANEQADYFKVVFEAQEQIFPGIKEKQYHLSYGMVNLTTGKMSSRTGDVITAEWLIEEAKNKIAEILVESKLTDAEKAEISEKVALGAIKFTMLHTTAKNNIAFNLDQAVKLHGDSGPYLQYAYTRIASILRSFDGKIEQVKLEKVLNEKDWELAIKLIYFPKTIIKCAEDYSPHHLTRYLLDLSAFFSSWYEQNSVKNAESDLQKARLSLLQAVKQVLQNGLSLLGIETVEKM